MIMYGIPNCDTIKKARKWLTENGIDYSFHDYRKDGLEETQLRDWAKELGWETLLNRRGLTWRKLEQSIRDNINENSAIKLMLENPAMIKRPMLDTGKQRQLGFSDTLYTDLLK